MIIDFHVHGFPESIAKNSIELLAKRSKTAPATDGTADGIIKSMEEGGVDRSVILPVMTSPKQFDNILDFAKKLNRDRRLISFGGIHPACEDMSGKLDRIKAAGIKGIKIHPDYHETDINDERYVEIVRLATERDLWITFHAGYDLGLVKSRRSLAVMIEDLLDKVPTERIIMAHMGAWKEWDDVEELYNDGRIYMDTAFCFVDGLTDEQFLRMVEKQGVEKILFATDSPWGRITQHKERIENMPVLTAAEKALILGGNATRILGL